MQLPLFDNMTIPAPVKVLTTLLFTYAIFPMVSPHVIEDIRFIGLNNFWMLTAFYTIVGLVLGFFVKIIMSAFVAAGGLITQQIGFAAVRYFDPSSSSQVGPFEKIIQWTMILMILSSGALLPMFKGVYLSFDSIQFHEFGKFASATDYFLKTFKSLFLAAILLSTPLLFTNMLIMTILGLIARTVPQMNVLMVSFVINIGLGLMVFTATSNEFFRVAFKIYTDTLGDWFQFVI
jgi:flagellar biosynthetic protein FliR